MNRGAVALAKKLPNHGDQRRFAAAHGIGEDVVSRWIRGVRTPSVKNRRWLQQEYNIPWHWWDERIEAAAA